MYKFKLNNDQKFNYSKLIFNYIHNYIQSVLDYLYTSKKTLSYSKSKFSGNLEKGFYEN